MVILQYTLINSLRIIRWREMAATVMECGTEQCQQEECLSTNVWLRTLWGHNKVKMLLLLSMVNKIVFMSMLTHFWSIRLWASTSMRFTSSDYHQSHHSLFSELSTFCSILHVNWPPSPKMTWHLLPFSFVLHSLFSTHRIKLANANLQRYTDLKYTCNGLKCDSYHIRTIYITQ